MYHTPTFKLLKLTLALLAVSPSAFAQNKEKNPKLKLPDIPGYVTLKCDFHMHTVYSDGHVWPSLRVNEAERDGLDAISITEHTDYEKFPDEVKRDREHAFQIAQNTTKGKHVLLIKGAEISPRVPPYHNNALFLQDLNHIPYGYMKQAKKTFIMKDDIKKADLMAPFLEVQKQGGFVIYNHPSYNWWDGKDKELFTDIHKELLAKGILGGVEVVNGNHYHLIAHRMAEKYNLTLTSGSDAHEGLRPASDHHHRPITLVFAKEKSVEAIKEALLNRRTLIYHDDYLIGRQPEAEAFFKASLTITAVKKKERKTQQVTLEVFNNSDVPYEVNCNTDYLIDNMPLGKTILAPHSNTNILLNPVWEYPQKITLKMKVANILVSPDRCLETAIDVSL